MKMWLNRTSLKWTHCSRWMKLCLSHCIWFLTSTIIFFCICYIFAWKQNKKPLSNLQENTKKVKPWFYRTSFSVIRHENDCAWVRRERKKAEDKICVLNVFSAHKILGFIPTLLNLTGNKCSLLQWKVFFPLCNEMKLVSSH